MNTTESLPRVGSAVIVEKNGAILLGKRNKEPLNGKWILPGGKIEPFEKWEDAAKRELREETGLEVEIQDIVTVQEIINQPNEHRIIIFSHAIVIGGEPKPSSDLADVRFFPPEELNNMEITETVRKVIEYFIKKFYTPNKIPTLALSSLLQTLKSP